MRGAVLSTCSKQGKGLTALPKCPFPRNKLVRNISLAAIEKNARSMPGVFFTDTGAMCVDSGEFTGRSPNDRYLVSREPSRGFIDWGPRNKALSPNAFEEVLSGAVSFMKLGSVYVFDGFAGSTTSPLKLRIYVTSPVQLQFCRCVFKTFNQLAIEDCEFEEFEPDILLFIASSYKVPSVRGNRLGIHSSTCVAFDFEQRVGLVVGSAYNGEIKKLVFSALNYYYPLSGHLSMHCAATRPLPKSRKVCGGGVALYFGLSGTGKTTLSTDPNRDLIGDDEHCWDTDGVFNIEGGCYAKVARLSQKAEPLIFHALQKGAVLENVVLDPETRVPNYDDCSRTENTRAAYSLSHVPHVSPREINPGPNTIIFLVCDAFGVLPPLSRLANESALYWFVAGFSSKIAGTELGSEGVPTPTFSPMFGGPFMPHRPAFYAEILRNKLAANPDIKVWLINTGWAGGPPGRGSRFELSITRKCVDACVNNQVDDKYVADPVFNLSVPEKVPGLPSHVLNPRLAWACDKEYEKASKALAALFRENWRKEGHPENLAKYGPC